LVASVRSGQADVPLTRLVLFADKPAIAAAATVRRERSPESEAPASLLIFVDLLDQRLLSQFSRDFGLADLHWQGPGEPASAASLPVS
jgi:sensor domain CHASE-containing protein